MPESELVTVHWLPILTGAFVTSAQRVSGTRPGPDCRTKFCALVDHNRTTLVLERESFNKGAAGLSFTVTELFALLLAATVSATALVTADALVNTPSKVGLTTTVAVAEAPLARLAALKVSVPLASDHDPLHCADISERGGGNESVTTTLFAVFGPLFVTTMVNVTLLEMNVVPGETDCETARSAAALTVVITDAELSAGWESEPA